MGRRPQPGALAHPTKLDMVITQVQMPFGKAREALDRIRAVEPPPKVVVVTTFEDPGLMRTFLRLGVSGYVLKSALSRQVVSEVRPAAFTYGADAGLVYGSRSRAFDQAENRLHAWKVLFYLLLG